jgi:hypothetical protein
MCVAYTGPLDPLLSSLANFTSPQHLQSQLDMIYTIFDIDDSGELDHDELNKGLCVYVWMDGCVITVCRCVCILILIKVSNVTTTRFIKICNCVSYVCLRVSVFVCERVRSLIP